LLASQFAAAKASLSCSSILAVFARRKLFAARPKNKAYYKNKRRYIKIAKKKQIQYKILCYFIDKK